MRSSSRCRARSSPSLRPSTRWLRRSPRRTDRGECERAGHRVHLTRDRLDQVVTISAERSCSVSNDPYGLDRPPAIGTRPTLDSGLLGLIVLDERTSPPHPPDERGARPRARRTQQDHCTQQLMARLLISPAARVPIPLASRPDRAPRSARERPDRTSQYCIQRVSSTDHGRRCCRIHRLPRPTASPTEDPTSAPTITSPG